MYNAPQLKRACLQFMCVNSASLLEGRYVYVRTFVWSATVHILQRVYIVRTYMYMCILALICFISQIFKWTQFISSATTLCCIPRDGVYMHIRTSLSVILILHILSIHIRTLCFFLVSFCYSFLGPKKESSSFHVSSTTPFILRVCSKNLLSWLQVIQQKVCTCQHNLQLIKPAWEVAD